MHEAVLHLVEADEPTPDDAVDVDRALLATTVRLRPDPLDGGVLALLDGIVSGQAAVLSFADTFWMASIAFLLTMPLLLLHGRGRPGAAISAGH